MKSLESFGVCELNTHEINQIKGGIWPLLLALTAMGIHDSIEHPDAFLKGFLGE